MKCEVASFAETAAQVIHTFDDLDCASLGAAGIERAAFQGRMDDSLDALAKIEEIARLRQATSFEGAMFQLMMIRQAAAQLHAPIDASKNDAVLEQIDHAIASIMRFLEGVSEIDRTAVCGDYYFPHDLNPHDAEPSH